MSRFRKNRFPIPPSPGQRGLYRYPESLSYPRKGRSRARQRGRFPAQQTGWVREFTWPWQSFLNTIPAVLPGAYADHPWWAAVFRAEIVAMAVGVAVTVACVVLSIRAYRRGERPLWAEASWVGVQVLAFSLSYWFFSVTRATLLWFPLWIFLGRWVGRAPARPDRRIAHRALVGLAFGIEILLMLWWCWLFFTGHWAS